LLTAVSSYSNERLETRNSTFYCKDGKGTINFKWKQGGRPLLNFFNYGFPRPISYEMCGENLFFAMSAHMSPPVYDRDYVMKIVDRYRYMLPAYTDIHPKTFYEWVKKFPLGRRNVLTKTYEEDNPDYKHYVFIKKDKLLIETYKVPRVVTAASDYMLVAMGPWYQAFTKCFKKSLGSASDLSPVFFACGTSGEQLGKWYSHWSQKFPLATEGDASKFDRSVSALLLTWEWDQYYRSMDAFTKNKFTKIEHAQIFVHAKGMGCGSSFNWIGKRCTGVSNTCVGNSLIHLLTLFSFMDSIGWKLGTDYAFCFLGDDILVFSRSSFRLPYTEHCRRFGFTLKSNETTNFSQVSFCQKVFWPTTQGYVPAPKIGRYLAKIGWSFKTLYDDVHRSEDLGHVPFLRKLPCVRTSVRTQEWEIRNRTCHEFVKEAYNLFEERYGFDISTLESLDVLPGFARRIISVVDNGYCGRESQDISALAWKRFYKEGGSLEKGSFSYKTLEQKTIREIALYHKLCLKTVRCKNQSRFGLGIDHAIKLTSKKYFKQL